MRNVIGGGHVKGRTGKDTIGLRDIRHVCQGWSLRERGKHNKVHSHDARQVERPGRSFAAFGIYRKQRILCFPIFYDSNEAKKQCESFLDEYFDINNLSKIPVRKTRKITDEPLIWRYFVLPQHTKLADSQLDEREFVARCVIKINSTIGGAHVFSSGKNMGVFKAVGYPEDVGRFYRLEEYEGYCFTAHGRYPTNTPGWWGGAHPFAMLDYSIGITARYRRYYATAFYRDVRQQLYSLTVQRSLPTS
jgi:hypothetical protein